MKKHNMKKRTLYRLHYFGEWHTGVRDTGTKSRKKFQILIDSGKLDIWKPLELYGTENLRIKLKSNINCIVGNFGNFECIN